MHCRFVAAAAVVASISSPATAQTPRELLTRAAFSSPDKATALTQIGAALQRAEAAIARNPRDQEARLQRGLAISYRGKLTRSRADLLASRRDFEAIVASDPSNAEAQLALSGWHLGAVTNLGPMLARTALGARTATGLQALDRAMAAGEGRALFPGFASIIRIQLNPKDIAESRRLAETALKARATEPADRLMQRQAGTLLKLLRTGNGQAAAKAAKQLLPFGHLD